MLNIEVKEDSPEKLAAIVGKPTKYFLNASEINQIVDHVKELETLVEQNILSPENFSSFINGLSIEDNIQDSDKFNFTKSYDGIQKKTTWLNIKAKLADVFNNLYVPKNRTITINGISKDLSDNREFNISSGATDTIIFQWQINQSIPASASWWRQDPQVGIRGNFTTNSSLTPANAFANNIVLTPAYTLPFQAKIKSVTVYGWTNQGATPVRFCINSSKISSVGGVTTPIDCLLLADFLVNTQNIQVNGFRHEVTSGLNTTPLPALQEIRLFWNNNNVGSNIFDGLVTVEFEKVV